MDEGKLWSLIRNALSQGGAIQLDRASMSGYEEYSARLDAAASDRVAEFAKLAESAITVRDTEIARLQTDLELVRRDAGRLDTLSAHLADDITICPPGKHGKGDGWLIFWQTGWDNYGQLGEETHGATLREAIDAARAGNGGEG